MADVSHELGALRHIVDSPLSSKVAMFNKVADNHNNSQKLNPFSGRGVSPGKPVFGKDEYGKPLAGSLTELRGQKANIHICKEMLELCQIIDMEGFPHPENPDLKVIFFGDLFNIYNHINDKCVGLLLRARKHKLIEFEGEMLFQRRDDEVAIIFAKPMSEIKEYLNNKTEELKRSISPAPARPTSLIMDDIDRKSITGTSTSQQSRSECSSPKSLSSTPRGPSPVPLSGAPAKQMNNIVKPTPTLHSVRSAPEIKITDTMEEKTETKKEPVAEQKSKVEEKPKEENKPKVEEKKVEPKVEEKNKIVEPKVEEKKEKVEDKKTEEKPKPEEKIPTERENTKTEEKSDNAAKVVIYVTKPPIARVEIFIPPEEEKKDNVNEVEKKEVINDPKQSNAEVIENKDVNEKNLDEQKTIVDKNATTELSKNENSSESKEKNAQ